MALLPRATLAQGNGNWQNYKMQIYKTILKVDPHGMRISQVKGMLSCVIVFT